MSEIICKSHLSSHDYEIDINNENEDCEEPNPSELDVYATFHLKVKKTTIISKFNQKETTPIGENGKQAFTYKAPSSVYSMNMKLQQKSMKHLGDKGDDILPKPLLNTRGLEEDRLILNYRKKKEKEEKLKEEERQKQEALEQRLRELDEKGNAKDDKNMKKRLITYDSKGDVIFIKNFRADVLPNPLLNPPYKIKMQKQNANKGESQLSDYQQNHRNSVDESQTMKSKKPLKSEKVQLLSQIDVPQIRNEIIPMGSVFNDTEPAEGIKLGEGGKFKYGSMNLSKRIQGQMSLEEYKIQKDQVILQAEMLETQKSFNKTGKINQSIKVEEQQTIDLDQSKDQNNDNTKQFDLKLRQVQMNIPVLNLDNLNQTQQMGQTMRMTFSKLDLSANSNNYQTQSALQSSRVSQDRDRVIRKRESLDHLIVDLKPTNHILDHDSLEQSSYVENLKQRQVSFATTQIFDPKQYRYSSQLATYRHSSQHRQLNNEMNNTITKSNKVLPPLLSHRKTLESNNEQVEILMNKNNEIMMNNNWGQNPSDLTKIPRKIERKPVVLEMKKSNSLLQLTSRKKERNFIESVKHRQHLPPPPLGKTFGHGISQLPTILNPNQTYTKFL